MKKIPRVDEAFDNIYSKQVHGCCDRVVCVSRYSGIIKDSLIRYKFFDKSCYYRALAGLMADKISNLNAQGGFDMIIGVPLHKNKESIRGYNQAVLISRELSRRTGIPEKSKLLTRVRNTESQSLLAKNERFHNVKDAFMVNNPEAVKDKRIILVDDILTTGNTLGECSRVLKEAGAKVVAGAVIATGRRS